MEKEEAAAKEALPAASTVKPVGVEDYALANTAADWNEGTVVATAPQNWAEDGTTPLAAAPVAPAAAPSDWAVSIHFLKLNLINFNVLLYIFQAEDWNAAPAAGAANTNWGGGSAPNWSNM